MQIWKSVYVIVFMWKQFRILNPKNSSFIDPWSLFYFLKIRRLFASLLLTLNIFVNYENVKRPLDYVFCFRVVEVFITRGSL